MTRILLTPVTAVPAVDVCAPFQFVGDMNGHQQEWLSSTTTNRYGVAAFDCTTVTGFDQLVAGPTHARGGTLDLLMTDVSELVRVADVAHKGNSDHSSLSVVILMAQAVINMCVSKKVFVNKSIGIVCGALNDLPRCNI